MHTTNYANTFITTAPDCGATGGTEPPKPDSVAGMQLALLRAAPTR